MSTISVSTVVASDVTAGTLRSTDANPPVIRNNAGVEIGTLCRAWVNFDGANGTRRSNHNVSSVTRVGVGDYVVNFATPMPDALYTVVGAADYLQNVRAPLYFQKNTANTSTQAFVEIRDVNTQFRDASAVFLNFFR
jgi:hypothetical protein